MKQISNNHKILALSPYHLTGIGTVQLTIIFLIIDYRISYLPLLVFILLCITAPFLIRFSFFLPVVSRGSAEKNSVSLTFDDGPDPHVTPEVLKLLSRNSVNATFFVTGKKAAEHPEIIKEILARGHTIGNHSFNHDNLLMLRSRKRLYEDIRKTQEQLYTYEIAPYAFRPPAGITNPRLRKVLLELGLLCVNFSCRAFDAGNRKIRSLTDKILRKVKAGDIILLHDIMPANKNTDDLLNEFSKIIAGLEKKKLKILPLSELIEKDVMGTTPDKNINPVKSFYDQNALFYDNYQFHSKVSIARSAEYKFVSFNLFDRINKSDKVLEIGAGTGIYTIPIAQRCADITAVDISDNMLKTAKAKAETENLNNIQFISADIEDYKINEKFDIICSFSAFEYIDDLSSLIKSLSEKLNPGGMLYFTTAHRSLFRFFTQIGNAIIQGVWLHSRSKRGIRKILKNAGLNEINISTHLFKSVITGGIILEVIALNKNN